MLKILPFAALLAIITWSCAEPTTPVAPPETARLDVAAELTADLEAPRHSSDGGGRAWLEEATAVRAGDSGRWQLHYEAGPEGVAVGGMVFLQVSPFWGWGTPQVEVPEAPGYSRVTTSAEGVELSPRTLGPQLLAVTVGGRPLVAGERLRFDLGAGPAGLRADTYAERESRFWIAVDGDGDGVRQWIRDAPGVDVLAGPPVRLAVVLPSTAPPGAEVSLSLAWLDAVGNATEAAGVTVTLTSEAPGLELPGEPLELAGGSRRVTLAARQPGVHRLRAVASNGVEAWSNPLWVAERAPALLWGDLHGHSAFSDGTGTPEDYFRYARDVAALDVVSLTDHDHWGLPFLDQRPDLWQEIERQVAAFHDPGRFVTLLGYEWTSWIYGHRHVLYFGDEGSILSAVDEAYDTPQELWQGLRGQDALTVAHHSAGGPVATDWTVPPDAELEPVTEVVSVHGSSEAADTPAPIYDPVAGNWVRDALDRGYRLGLIGSGDGHDGHPGHSHLVSRTGGLVALLTADRTRQGVLEALRQRRVYATSGPRIVLEVHLGEVPMGGEAEAGDGRLEISLVAAAVVERVDIVRSGEVVTSLPGQGRRQASAALPLPGLRSGEYVYVRVVQVDGGLAFSSPIFIS